MMRNMILLFWLFSKRLYKRVSIYAAFLLIAFIVVGFASLARDEKGIVTIALAYENEEDQLSAQVVDSLMSSSNMILFYQSQPEEAAADISAGKADAAWIFSEDLESRMIQFANGDHKPFVHIIQREQTVPLMLAREKLTASLYAYCSEYVYLRYLQENLADIRSVSEQELLDYLNDTGIQSELFTFYNVNGDPVTVENDYMLSPVRGLLAIVAAMAAVVNAMSLQKDIDRGLFCWVSKRYQITVELCYQLATALPICLVSYLAMLFGGIDGEPVNELLLIPVYSLCCASFGLVIPMLFGNRRLLAAMLPVIVIAMLVICPVFFDISVLRLLQMLLPPTYYIHGGYNLTYLIYGLVFCILMFFLRYGIQKFIKRTI